MIAWRYFDKTAATVAAMRDYGSMLAIINNTPENIKAVYERMVSPRSSALTGMPSARNPKAAADRLAAQVDKLDLLRERYGSAMEYMAWFEPAWKALTETERHILRESYMGNSCRSGSTARLMSELNFTERHIERLRSKSLRRLQLLLFG